MEKELLPVGNKCNGCYACVSKCPSSSISMKTDNEGFWYPEIDEKSCIKCGLCQKTCPVINEKYSGNISNIAFAAINSDDEIRNCSSSGGIFYLLASSILKMGGIVFGAAFTSDNKAVEHIAVDSIEKLRLLMGSKYLQSRIGAAYKQAKYYLDSGRKVLFSGTPCQIGGLYAYLGKDYENLITQDVICHGVPSPLVWEKYVEYRESKAASKTLRTFFRHKKYGWKMFSVQFIFKNCTEYIQIISNDLYMRGFLANLYLRPSCHNCSFKSANRISDITLADFWGIENIAAEMYDEKGTSLVLVNTDKADKIFDSIKSDIKFCSVDKGGALKYNSAAVKCPAVPENRIKFMNDLSNKPFSYVMSKYCGIKITNKIKGLIRKILSKM